MGRKEANEDSGLGFFFVVAKRVGSVTETGSSEASGVNLLSA